MRMTLRFILLFLLAAPGTLIAGDNLQEAVVGLESKDTATYNKAVSYLSKHRSDAATLLKKLLADYEKPPIARLRAAMLLGDFGSASAAEDLKNALTSGKETNAAVRSEIIGSLGRLGRKDIVADYYNSGSEKSPSTTAAVARALQGSTDEKSKLALAHLLASSDNGRVSEAAVLAIEKSLESFLSSQADTNGKRVDFAKALSEAKDQANNPAHPEFTANVDWSSPISPTTGDKAIIAALKSKVKVNDTNPGVDKDAQALLLMMSKVYKQTESPN